MSQTPARKYLGATRAPAPLRAADAPTSVRWPVLLARRRRTLNAVRRVEIVSAHATLPQADRDRASTVSNQMEEPL